MFRFIVLLLAVVHAYAGLTDPNFKDGRKVIVHLFEWKWNDIAEECENFLGPYGYAGVQVSPPNGHRYISGYPWWQRYQPENYNLNSRSGSEAEFSSMVNRCESAGVRIYVDAVINHMAADDSYYFGDVPYYSNNFNVPNGRCSSWNGQVNNYNDPNEVRYCNLVGLDDLDFRTDATSKVTAFLNKMIGYGVAGFRIDAAKHMHPTEIQNIVNGLQNCNFGGRPYIFQEVIDQSGTEAITSGEYVDHGDVTEFKYCNEIAKVGHKTTALKYFVNFGQSWGMLPSSQAFVFVDNHDNQRGHGGAGDILTFEHALEYKKSTAFGLAWDYGTSRIMSSYRFSDGDEGPPSDNQGNTESPQFNADSSCQGDWVCEHRWRQIRNMACFRNAAGSAGVSNWADNDNNFISFSRGNNAFFAISNEGYNQCHWRQTGLPGGTYCDLISGDPNNVGCTGTQITVYADGMAEICLDGSKEDPMVALTYRATSGSGGGYCKW